MEETSLIETPLNSTAKEKPTNHADIKKAGYSYFRTKSRRVDFIIEYQDLGKQDTRGNIDARKTYFDNLRGAGLKLEFPDHINRVSL